VTKKHEKVKKGSTGKNLKMRISKRANCGKKKKTQKKGGVTGSKKWRKVYNG